MRKCINQFLPPPLASCLRRVLTYLYPQQGSKYIEARQARKIMSYECGSIEPGAFLDAPEFRNENVRAGNHT